MNGIPQDVFVQTWKAQIDAGMRAIEAVLEGAMRVREIQLKAAAEAHAYAQVTRRAMAIASHPAQLFTLQMQWGNANLQTCVEYWRSVHEIVAQMNGEIAKCMHKEASSATSAAARGAALSTAMVSAIPAADESKKALLAMMDGVYKQWLDATQQFYRFPAIPTQGGSNTRAAA